MRPVLQGICSGSIEREKTIAHFNAISISYIEVGEFQLEGMIEELKHGNLELEKTLKKDGIRHK
jgi:hypothetical protein